METAPEVLTAIAEGRTIIKQEAFNVAFRHAVVEKQPPAIEEGTCKYRSLGGFCCFVGRLIPDDRYNTEMDESGLGGDAGAILRGFPDELDFLQINAEGFLTEIQRCHDRAASSNYKAGLTYLPAVEASLRELAANYNLEIPA